MGLIKFLDDHKTARERSLFISGYDYAAGSLLRGDKTIEQLQIESLAMVDWNPFDKGIEEAIVAFSNLKTLTK